MEIIAHAIISPFQLRGIDPPHEQLIKKLQPAEAELLFAPL